jgi:hypothetical protein
MIPRVATSATMPVSAFSLRSSVATRSQPQVTPLFRQLLCFGGVAVAFLLVAQGGISC